MIDGYRIAFSCCDGPRDRIRSRPPRSSAAKTSTPASGPVVTWQGSELMKVGASKPLSRMTFAALLETTRGQGRSDHLKCEALLFCIEIRQHHTVPEHVRVNVEPGPLNFYD